MPAAPELSVVICSRDGGSTIGTAVRSLQAQTVAERIEILVVDDGSADATAGTAAALGATVVRHRESRGLAAARNTGLSAARAPIVGFIDDDCEAEPRWAELLLSAYEEGVAGVGSTVRPGPGDGFARAYLRRHNPLEPLELELRESSAPLYRLRLYLRDQWRHIPRPARRDVFSLVGAGMSFRRDLLLEGGLFDERFAFGAEELEFCYRARRRDPDLRLVLESRAAVIHHFRPSVRDSLRRSRAYGRGSARLHRRWPSVNPTVFPIPLIVAALAALAVRRPRLASAALLAPAILYPAGVRAAIAGRRPALALDAYVQLAQEACGNLGVVEGLRRYRHIEAVGA